MPTENPSDQHSKSDAIAPLPLSHGKRNSLLIVEDTLLHSGLIAHIADKVGFTTETASSFEDACSRLCGRQFDCITLDLGLGQHVGSEVLYYLAKGGCAAWIIIISGSEKNICDKMVQIGHLLHLKMCDPVPKPIDLKKLRATLEHIRTHSKMETFSTRTF